MANLQSLRLPEPPKYDGATDFEKWSKQIRTYLMCANVHYGEMMDYVQDRGSAVDLGVLRAILNEYQKHGGLEKDFVQMNSTLYYLLMSHSEKSAFTIIDNVDQTNGLEAWRKLHERFAHTKRQRTVMSLAAVMKMQLPDDNSLEENFTMFERELDKFERATGDTLPETAKIGIVVAVTTGKLHDHLVLNMGGLDTYYKVRSTIMNYIKSKPLVTTKLQNIPLQWR